MGGEKKNILIKQEKKNSAIRLLPSHELTYSRRSFNNETNDILPRVVSLLLHPFCLKKKTSEAISRELSLSTEKSAKGRKRNRDKKKEQNIIYTRHFITHFSITIAFFFVASPDQKNEEEDRRKGFEYFSQPENLLGNIYFIRFVACETNLKMEEMRGMPYVTR